MARSPEDLVRADAKARGQTKFLGKVCKRHPSNNERWTSNGTCTVCVAETAAKYWKKNNINVLLRKKDIPDTEENIKRVEEHNGKCDICGGNGDGRYDKLNIDHCHTTKKFRGMLCRKCNSGIGFFMDSPELLARAIEYLKDR